jgi:hypothetical protein
VAVLAAEPAAMPLRCVIEGRVLRSPDPTLQLEVAAPFTYIGGQRFILREIADAEQHLFVDADGERRIRRLYWVQFEMYLPESPGQYSYDDDESTTLSGLPVRAHVRRYIDPPAPDSDRRRVHDLLAREGYSLPEPATRVRFVHLPTPDRRQEVMIIYVEPAPGAAALTSEESAAIMRRAEAGLSVRR